MTECRVCFRSVTLEPVLIKQYHPFVKTSALLPSRHISVPIKRPPADVYAFTSHPAHLPQWASGLSDSIEKVGDAWVASESPLGRITIAFADTNPFGVLDHTVTLESGDVFHNPMRVLPNNDGSEIVFTLFRRPEVSDAEFEKDAQTIEGDLRQLKSILEKS